MRGASSGVEELPWTRTHTIVFITFSLSTAIEAYIYSISYIATGWIQASRILTVLLSVWPPLWLLLGGAIMGPAADALGRKRALYLTLLMYLVGAAGLILVAGGYLLLAFLSLLLFATGGEYNVVMAASHEYFPRRWRGRAVFLVLNFTNLGGALAASLALLNAPSPSLQRAAIGITVLVAVPMFYALRVAVPESVRWLESVGRSADAEREAERHFGPLPPAGKEAARVALPPWSARLIVGALLGWSYTAGMTLMALTLGPYFMPSLTNWLILAFSLASLASGAAVALAADRVGRRELLLLSSSASLALAAAMALTTGAWMGSPPLFWSLFLPFSAFVNAFFLGEDALKSEFWGTRRRASYLAAVRAASLGGSIPVVFLTAYLPMGDYLMAMALVFGVGAAAAVAWYLMGAETGRGASVGAWDHA